MIELRQQHSLAGLLQAAGLSRSTFYYQQKVLQLADKYADVKERIGVIYAQHKGRYGYRRITAMLRLGGSSINHKTVQRLMDLLHLKSCVCIKKYRAYRGEIGHLAPNLLARNFDAARPNEKWVTDVTEFSVGGVLPTLAACRCPAALSIVCSPRSRTGAPDPKPASTPSDSSL